MGCFDCQYFWPIRYESAEYAHPNLCCPSTRFGMDSTQAPGFLQESGATGLAYTHDSSAPNLLPRKAQGGASGLPPSAPSGQDRRRS